MRPFTPSQIVIGGCLLAFGASFLNTGFLLSMGTSVSHLTGDIARIGSGLSAFGNAEGFHILNVATATAGFILGAIISGFLLHHPTVEISKPYGRILSVLGISLVAAHYSHIHYSILSIAIASAACGVQNALASRYRGMVLRTTHLTGLFTDFGIHLGMKLRGHRIESWKLSIPIFITVSFLLGAIASSAFIQAEKDNWLFVAGIGYLVSGASWSAYKRTRSIQHNGAQQG
ncbi:MULTISPECIES: YoaK family protein [unclassified Lentimonas]|uniref:YoaK family protein n=1 Tax=unclassified Lentimonas TaxID=2630993 RepID=UPI0013251BEA|nr:MULTISPECIES: YoaK family protein [unclassified Lentimonas]CAA6679053.1 Unannotated [Lentimonas sp. CC4]CAA6684207.1 Unannotated [Lentimonas sp. CC6]CAA6693691.1 Unannotated [Lentimonas sp. CC10]CAA6696100.1 Unannotated [Lentimonas sp. CC19]CAA7071678.1 Unannotated [Lentimonas sp. CC11]